MTTISEFFRKMGRKLPKDPRGTRGTRGNKVESEEIQEIMQGDQLFNHPVFKEIQEIEKENNG